MRTFAYVITADKGTAPCRGDGWLTLAICKPAIRRRADPGDLIVALNGRGLGDPYAVRWAGVVKEKLAFGQYSEDPRFKDRADNIYHLMKGSAGDAAQGDYKHVGGDLHPSKEQQGRDLRGRYVLVFERWWHFGAGGPPAPEGLRLASGRRRGHKIVDTVSTEWLGAPLGSPRPITAAAAGSSGTSRSRPRPRAGACSCRC